MNKMILVRTTFDMAKLESSTNLNKICSPYSRIQPRFKIAQFKIKINLVLS
jgi:hypothetical protein